MHIRALAVLLVVACAARAQPAVPLTAGMVITRSVRIVPGEYRLDAPADSTKALITIRGSNITVDFAGATLRGAPASADPDRRAGVAMPDPLLGVPRIDIEYLPGIERRSFHDAQRSEGVV